MPSLPYQPSYVIIARQIQNVLVDYSDDRTRFGRTKAGRYFEYDLEFKNRQLNEFQAFQVFYNKNYPATAFTWLEPYQNVTHDCYFISTLDYQINFDNSIDYRVRIQTTVS